MNQSAWRDAGGDDNDPRADPAPTVQASDAHLDLPTVLKVLQVVSGETGLERVITTVLRQGLEYAGAERGLLILQTGDAFQIEADAVNSNDGARVTRRQSAVTAEELPESILQYVLRTRQPVLLNDASPASPFFEDEYLRRHDTRSALCMPLLKETKLVGLIYLESERDSGVFTPARTAVLELLACAAAISLENALLNHDLQQREAKVRRLVDSNIIGILTWHADGRVLGIGVQSISMLFDAFYTTKSEGMGIGLSVSRSIIERHHGRLWAQPNDGPGSTFAFSIPCNPQ
jgi:hypothetical protein